MAQVAEKRQEIFLEAEGVAPAPLSRVWGAVIWPGMTTGYALVGAQEKKSRRVHLLVEVAERDWRELTRRLVELGRGHKVSRWLQERGMVGRPSATGPTGFAGKRC